MILQCVGDWYSAVLVITVGSICRLLYHYKQDIKMSNFTHILVTNNKEIQIFKVNMSEYLLLKHNSNPSTIKTFKKF